MTHMHRTTPSSPPAGHRSGGAGAITVAAIAAAAALMLSCGDCCTEPVPQPPAPVATSLTVTPASAEFAALGETVQLAAEVRDQNGQAMAAAPVTWSSSDAAVATVGSAGLVTAAGNGSATITATSGSASGTATVAVAQRVGAVVVLPDGGSVVERDTVRFEAQATDANGHPVAGVGFSWASSDTFVAVVDDEGLVTGVGAGEAEVTAIADGVTGRAGLTVMAAVPTTLTVAPDTVGFASLGDTVRLVAEVRDQLGRGMAEVLVSWASGDTQVAVVDSTGLVTAAGGGTTTVSATADEVSEVAVVTVTQSAGSVVVSPAADTIAPGDTLRLVAEALDANGHRIADASFAWSSTDPSVAQVDDAGLVRGRSEGMTTITATTGSVRGTALITISVPNREPVAIDTIPPQTVSAGDTARVDVAPYFADADGDALVYTAASSNEAAVSALVTGSVVSLEAVAQGTAEVTVTATDPGGLSAQQGFEVEARDRSTPTILRVEPPVLVEGQSATIIGWGFSALVGDNEVFVGGLPARVLSSTATRLSITVPRADCLPPREVLLRVSTAAGRDSVVIGSTPLSEEGRNWPQFEWRHTSSGDGCMHLPGNAQGGEFLIGVTSVSEDPSHLARITLAGRPGDASILAAYKGSAVPQAGRVAYSRYPAPLVSTSSRVRPPLSISGVGPQQDPGGLETLLTSWRARHAEAMARNQALAEKLGRPDWSARSSGDVSARSSLAEGDTVTLNTICCDNPRVRAVVRLITDNFVWLDDDLANPDGPFTDAELTEMDDFYSDHAQPVHENYFGSLSDVDGNGRILVLMTNENESAGVNPCDLYPKDQCRWSNEAEIFYHGFPDSDRRDGMLSFLPTYLTHEATHLIQYTAWVFGDAPRRKGEWELEGGAILSEHFVGHRLFGQSSGQNLGYPEYSAGRDWYRWHGGLFDFFSGGRGAPEECTWLTYKGWGGNDGPCELSLNYWVGAMVLQFAMDRWGGRYPGGERAMLKRMTQSPLIGFANLVDVSPGWSIERILGEFYATLWLEGTAGRDTPGMTSWDIHDIISRFDDSLWLNPYSSSSATPSVSARIRGGSSMYFHWTPDGPLPPASFKVEPAGDGPVFVWAIRAR